MTFEPGYTYILKDPEKLIWLPRRIKIISVEPEDDTIHALLDPRDRPDHMAVFVEREPVEDSNLERISMTGGIWGHYTLDLNQTLEDINHE